MGGAIDVLVILASVVLVVALVVLLRAAPRRAGAARLEGGVQRVEVTVRGGYLPAHTAPPCG
jgi:Cu+-exporting ATPase